MNKFDRFDSVQTSKRARVVTDFLTFDGHQRYVVETVNGDLQIMRESELARWETALSFHPDEASLPVKE